MIIPKMILNNGYDINDHKTLVNALNVELDKNFTFLVAESGNVLKHTFVHPVCGIIPTSICDIVFCTNSNGTDEIYTITDTTTKKRIMSGNLGFNSNNTITGCFTFNSHNQLIIAWTDNINPVRLINVDSRPYLYYDTLQPDKLDLINLTPNLKQPIYNLSKITSGGSIKLGTYYFAIAYYITDYDLSNWSLVSPPIHAIDPSDINYRYSGVSNIRNTADTTDRLNTSFEFTDRLQQSSNSEYTNQKFYINISNLDTRLSKFKLGVIHKTDTATNVYDVLDVKYSGRSNITVTYDGTYSGVLSIDEITISTINIDKVKTITTQANKLLLGGITKNTELKYQPYANNIKVNYNVRNVIKEYDTVTSFSFTGLVPDEVYGLYIGLVLNNGNIDKFYHIPGRAPRAINKLYGSVYEDPNKPLEIETVSTLPDYNSKYRSLGYEDFKSKPIYQVMNTADTVADATPATAILGIDYIDIASDGGIQGKSTFKINYKRHNNINTYVSFTIKIDRSEVPSDIYKLLGNNNNETYDEIKINNSSDPNWLLLIGSPILGAIDSVMGMGPDQFKRVVIAAINVSDSGYTAVLNSDEFESITIFAPREYGAYASKLKLSFEITNNCGEVLGVKYGTECSAEILSYFIDNPAIGSSGLNTGSSITFNIGRLPIFSYTIPENATTRSLLIAISNLINDNTSHISYVANDQFLYNNYGYTVPVIYIQGDINLGSSIENEIYNVSLTSDDVTILLPLPVGFTGGIYNDSDSKSLAYWENEDETYPDTSDYLIWDVDDDGNTIVTGNNLKGLKVRHHKMPDIYNLYTPIEDTKLTKVISLNITDIKFPTKILSKIQGYVLAYAVKGTGNLTVFGSAPVTKDNMYGLTNYSGQYIRFSDFNLTTSKLNIANSYLKVNLASLPIIPNKYVYELSEFDVVIPKLYNVTQANYLPRDNSATAPSNEGREETLMLKLGRLYNDVNVETQIPVSGTGLVSTLVPRLEMADLCSRNSNIYMPFAEQKLSIVGSIHPISQSIYSYSINDTYGFDCYLNNHVEIQFRGNQNLITKTNTDGESVYTRENGDGDNNPTSVINVYKFKSYSLINYLARTLDMTTSYELEFTRRNWINQLKDLIQYKTNFNILPSSPHPISYNYMYNYVNNIRTYNIFSPLDIDTDAFYNRIYETLAQNKESLSIGWRNINVLSYYEIGKHRGAIVNLAANDTVLIIHTEYAIFIAKIKDKITYSDEEVYLGRAEIFDREPEELQTSNTGNLAIQSNVTASISDLGYMFYNPYSKIVYIYSNKGLKTFNSVDCNEYIQNNFSSNKNVTSWNQDCVFIAYDKDKDKIIICNNNDNPITLSSNASSGNIISKHSYHPGYIYSNINGLYMLDETRTKLYKGSIGAKGSYFGETYKSYVDVLLRNSLELKQLTGLNFVSSNKNQQNINSIIVYTENQISKEYILTEFNSITDWDKIRYSNGRWFYNNIRDYSSDTIVQSIITNTELNYDTSINLNKNWYELSMFENNYFIVRIIANNPNDIIFNDVDFEYTKLEV